jgi:hypothetical protein
VWFQPIYIIVLCDIMCLYLYVLFCLSFFLPVYIIAFFLSLCLSGYTSYSVCMPLYICHFGCLSCLFVCLLVYSFVCMSVCTSICLFSIHKQLYPSICLSDDLSGCLCVCLHVFPPVHPLVRLSFICLRVHLFVCLSISPISLSVCLKERFFEIFSFLKSKVDE